MDINSRINWKPGMEMTAKTFAGMNNHIDFQQQVAIQAALGNTRIGILPDAPFNNTGVFVRNTYEMEHFRCTALLPSGRIIDADEQAIVTIPLLYGHIYYLTVGFGEGQTEFEKEGVPYVRPKYVYRINTLEEIEGKDLMPVARFIAEEGVFTIDSDFIPPTLQLICNERFKTYIEKYVERLETIASHPHLVDEFGKRAILHYLFMMKSYNLRSLTSEFIQFNQEIAQAINYYIMAPHTNVDSIPTPTQYDVETWLKWLDTYLVSAISVLDQADPKDNTINMDELKAQIKAELYEKMTPELHNSLLAEVKEELTSELGKYLTDTLTDYMENTLKPTLYSQIREELPPNLYQTLYDSLYQALFNALFVPPETTEEATFIPMI